MNRLDSHLTHTQTTMRKNKRRRLVAEQDVEAALQLIQLKNFYRDIVLKSKEVPEARDKNHDDNFLKIVLKSKEFLEARDINRKNKHDNKSVCNSGYEKIRKRKSEGIASCSSSITFDVDDAKEAVGSVKKMKKFRSVADIYSVTKPL